LPQDSADIDGCGSLSRDELEGGYAESSPGSVADEVHERGRPRRKKDLPDFDPEAEGRPCEQSDEKSLPLSPFSLSIQEQCTGKTKGHESCHIQDHILQFYTDLHVLYTRAVTEPALEAEDTRE